MRAAQFTWPEQGFPPFDIGPDGFPRPGQVVRHFRQIKLRADGSPWTQRDLAQALGKQELAVREMELRDVGLNDIARRRFLVTLLGIPPILFGLIVAPECERTEDATEAWWVQQGFPAFDADEDGFPHPGQVLRHFRLAKLRTDGKPWTQRDLAQMLGKQELAMRDMERRGVGLNDISRRRFLAHFFDIPLALFGLAAVPAQGNTHLQVSPLWTPKVLKTSDSLDLEMVRNQLTLFWTQNASAFQDVLATIDSTLKKLYERYPTASSSTRLETIAALCELHIHAANILRDRGRTGKSLEHLNKAKGLNALLQENELQADVLYRRGGVYLEKGELALALDDYHVAEQIITKVSPSLQAAILLELALSEARVATSQHQQMGALKKLDRAGHIIRVEQTASRERGPYLNVDIGRYHLDRAATLIAVGFFQEAQQELNLLSDAQLRGRRPVYYLILQAQACFGLKEYAQAALLAEQALPLVRETHSRVNFERIKVLYKQLRQTPFRNNPEVGRLEYLLVHT
jgi:tetratricopeptide (TPR) repeat protein